MAKELVNMFLLLGCAVIVLYVVDKYFQSRKEGFEDKKEYENMADVSDQGYRDAEPDTHKHQDVSQESVQAAQTDVEGQQTQQQQALGAVSGREQLKPKELLPQDKEANAWAAVNPKGKGSLEFKNFLEAGYHIGVDTQSNSLRNANRQVRSEPANPQVPVSIWMNSTIGSDPHRLPLSIGCEPSK